MDLNHAELSWIEEQIEEAWDDLRHYPNDYVSGIVNELYRKVELAKKQLRSER